MCITLRRARFPFRPSVLTLAVHSTLLCAVLATPSRAQEDRPEEVLVTATALRENPLEVAQPTAIVGGDELRRQIASSIGETLGQELGVSSTYFGPSASRPVIRGLGGDRVQMLEDGLSALDVSGLSQDHAVSVEAVVSEQIEIIKGPAALLYGSGAAGGLVNVVSNRIPSRSADTVSGAVEARGASATDEFTGAMSLNGGAGAIAWHADYFDRQTDNIRVPGFAQSRRLREALIAAGETPDDAEGEIANSASDTRGGALGLSYVGDAGHAGVAYSRYESVYGIPVEEEAFIDMQQDRYDLSGEWRPDSTFVNAVRVRGAYNDYTHTEFEAPGEPGTRFFQTASDLRVAVDHQFGDWRGTIGAQTLDIDFEALGEEAYVPPSQTRALSVFAFEERHLADWTVELGARIENQTVDPDPATLSGYDATAANFSAGLVWKFVEDHALALNVTRTERHPQAAELYAEGPHLASGRIEVGDASLDIESALTLDLSLRHGGEGITWTVNTFYNDYDDYIFLDPTGVDAEIEPGEFLPVFQVRQQAARLYGYEAEILVPLNLVSVADIEVRLSSDYVRGKLAGGGNLPQMPAQRYGLGLHTELGDWHAGLEAFYNAKQTRVAEYELPTDSFVTVNADLSHRMEVGATDLFLFLRGSNLLDEDARQATSPLKDVVPLPGRSLSAGVRVTF